MNQCLYMEDGVPLSSIKINKYSTYLTTDTCTFVARLMRLLHDNDDTISLSRMGRVADGVESYDSTGYRAKGGESLGNGKPPDESISGDFARRNTKVELHTSRSDGRIGGNRDNR